MKLSDERAREIRADTKLRHSPDLHPAELLALLDDRDELIRENRDYKQAAAAEAQLFDVCNERRQKLERVVALVKMHSTYGAYTSTSDVRDALTALDLEEA